MHMRARAQPCVAGESQVRLRKLGRVCWCVWIDALVRVGTIGSSACMWKVCASREGAEV